MAADARAPIPTQRCLLQDGSYDGQLRLAVAGVRPTLTLQQMVDGEWWAETYVHEGANAQVPSLGPVPVLLFSARDPVETDRAFGMPEQRGQ